jgi:hypothetical protein
MGGRLRYLFGAAALLPFMGLLLPASGPERAVTATAAFSLRSLSMFTLLFAVAVPVLLAKPRRDSGLEDLVLVRPLGGGRIFAGRVLGALGLLLLWWFLLLLGGWAAMEIAAVSGGRLDPQRRIRPKEGGESEQVLAPQGQDVLFKFRELDPAVLADDPVILQMAVGLKLTGAAAGVFGAPLRVEAVNPETGRRHVALLDRPSLRGPLRVALPREVLFPGRAVDLTLGLGPSPFRAHLRPGDVYLLGRGAGLFLSFLGCGVGILCLAMALAALSAAAAQALSRPVAWLLGLSVWVAGETGAFVSRAATATLQTMPGGAYARPGAVDSPLQEIFLQGIALFTSLMPDFSSFLSARDLLQGHEVSWSDLCRRGAAALAAAAVLFVVGGYLTRLGRGGHRLFPFRRVY